jgi:hypothetical protein
VNILALPKQSCGSAWIFYLEFSKKYFWAFQAHRKQDMPRHFFISKKLKFYGGYCRVGGVDFEKFFLANSIILQ